MDRYGWLGVVALQEGRWPVEEWLRFVTEAFTRFAEGIAVLIIAIGIVRALIGWAAQHAPNRRQSGQTDDIRWEFGRSLILGLEFLLAADILATAVAPTWEAIGKLAAIVVIRTGLDFYLEWELSRERNTEEGRKSA